MSHYFRCCVYSAYMFLLWWLRWQFGLWNSIYQCIFYIWVDYMLVLWKKVASYLLSDFGFFFSFSIYGNKKFCKNDKNSWKCTAKGQILLTCTGYSLWEVNPKIVLFWMTTSFHEGLPTGVKCEWYLTIILKNNWSSSWWKGLSPSSIKRLTTSSIHPC